MSRSLNAAKNARREQLWPCSMSSGERELKPFCRVCRLAPRGSKAICSNCCVNSLLRREPPAGARDLRRGDVDVFFETHQLPVAGALRKAVAGLAGGGDHGVVGAQRLAKDGFGAEGARAAF